MKPGTARTAAGLAVVAVVAVGVIAAQGARSEAAAWVERLLSAVQGAGPLGWLAFAAVQALVATIGLVPASLLGIGAGLAYGTWLGFLLSATGTLTGGWTAFQLSRSLLRPWIARLLARRLQAAALDDAIARDGWRVVCLLRISPVMPFAVTSYMLGLTGMETRSYLLGYVILGALANDGLSATLESAGPLHWAMLAAGLAATGLATLRLGQLLTVAGLIRMPGI